MDPDLKLKENGSGSESTDISQASTAVLESIDSSQDTPPIIRGASLLDSRSPKHKPKAIRPDSTNQDISEIEIDDPDDDIECLPPSPEPNGRPAFSLRHKSTAKEASLSISKGKELTLSPTKRSVTTEVASLSAKFEVSESCGSASDEVRDIVSKSVESSEKIEVDIVRPTQLQEEQNTQRISFETQDVEFSLTVSQAPQLATSPVISQLNVSSGSLAAEEKGCEEGQRILADNTADSVNVSLEKHTASFNTPDNAQTSTPHNLTASTEKLSSIESSLVGDARIQEFDFKYGHVSVNRPQSSITIRFADNKTFEFERFMLSLGPEVRLGFEHMLERQLISPSSGYSGDLSSSSSSGKSRSELIKTAISNSFKITDPHTHQEIEVKSTSLSTVVLEDTPGEAQGEAVSFSQAETQVVVEAEAEKETPPAPAHVDTPKSGRKRTKTSVRRSSTKARSLTAIQEDDHDGRAVRRPAAKRRLDSGSSTSTSLQDTEDKDEEKPKKAPPRKRTKSSTKKPNTGVSSDLTSTPENRDEPLPMLAPESPTKQGTPSTKAKKGRESAPAESGPAVKDEASNSNACAVKEEPNVALSLGEKIDEENVSVVSDEEVAVKAEKDALRLRLKQDELQPGLDVYAFYGRFYYPAKIIGEGKNGKWNVRFFDGLQSEIAPCRIIPIKFVPRGTPVYGDCESGVQLPGIIIGYRNTNEVVEYIVQLDKGETLVVPRTKIILTQEQLNHFISDKPSIRTPLTVDLDNVVAGKRKRTQRTDLQVPASPPTPKRRGKKDTYLETSTFSESDFDIVASPKRTKTPKKLPVESGETEKPTPKKPEVNHLKKVADTPVILKGAKQIFNGYGFLLTKKDPRPETEDEEMSDTESVHSSVIFDKADLRREIEERGGIVFDRFMDTQLHPRLQMFLISNRACRTEKYIYSLAAGYPPVHNAWITDSITFGSVVAYTRYLLPAAIFGPEIIEWTHRGRILESKKILIVSDDPAFTKFWSATFMVAGASKVTVFEFNIIGTSLECDFIMGKAVAEQSSEDRKMLTVIKNLNMKSPGVSNYWSILCLAYGHINLKAHLPNCSIW